MSVSLVFLDVKHALTQILAILVDLLLPQETKQISVNVRMIIIMMISFQMIVKPVDFYALDVLTDILVILVKLLTLQDQDNIVTVRLVFTLNPMI